MNLAQTVNNAGQVRLLLSRPIDMILPNAPTLFNRRRTELQTRILAAIPKGGASAGDLSRVLHCAVSFVRTNLRQLEVENEVHFVVKIQGAARTFIWRRKK